MGVLTAGMCMGATTEPGVVLDLEPYEVESAEQTEPVTLLLDANVISEKNLTRFPSFGPKIVAAYVRERLQFGAFADLSEIVKRVTGIGVVRAGILGKQLSFSDKGMQIADVKAEAHRDEHDPEAETARSGKMLILVNVNAASLEELMGVSGIGLKKAGSIKGRGPWISFKHLQDAKIGIGPVLVSRMHAAGMVCE